MISICALFRNAGDLAAQCLRSLLSAHTALALSPPNVEYIFVDDCSDESQEIIPLLREFRATVAPAEVKILRFRQHRHYTHGVATILSIARGNHVLFFSHDMFIPRACISALLEVCTLHA